MAGLMDAMLHDNLLQHDLACLDTASGLLFYLALISSSFSRTAVVGRKRNLKKRRHGHVKMCETRKEKIERRSAWVERRARAHVKLWRLHCHPVRLCTTTWGSKRRFFGQDKKIITKQSNSSAQGCVSIGWPQCVLDIILLETFTQHDLNLKF